MTAHQERGREGRTGSDSGLDREAAFTSARGRHEVRHNVGVRKALFEHVLLPLGDLFLGQDLRRRLGVIRDAQWQSPAQLQARQVKALRSLLKTAYNETGFYQRLFSEAGVHPEDVREVADLRRLPVVTKAMIRAAEPGAMSRDTGQRTHNCNTSGSTGENLSILKDARTLGVSRASFMLAAAWAGWEPGERHLQMGMNLTRSVDRRLKDFFLRCRYMSAFELQEERLDAALHEIRGRAIRHVWGYPGALEALFRRARETGERLEMRSVISWGDTLALSSRREIEEASSCRVTDTYGCGEIGQVSAQCGSGDGYHVHMLDVVVEVLRADGTTCGPGEAGSLVLTRLHPGPMPLVRYAVGDIGAFSEMQECGCGRGFSLLEGIRGRESDVIVTPLGNRLIVHFFTGIIENYCEVEAFQVVQTKEDELTVKLALSGSRDATFVPRLKDELISRGAAGMKVNIERVERISLAETGKRRFVIALPQATGSLAAGRGRD